MRPGYKLVIWLWLPCHLLGIVSWAPILAAEWLGPGFAQVLPNWRYMLASVIAGLSWLVSLFVVAYLWEYFHPSKGQN